MDGADFRSGRDIRMGSKEVHQGRGKAWGLPSPFPALLPASAVPVTPSVRMKRRLRQSRTPGAVFLRVGTGKLKSQGTGLEGPRGTGDTGQFWLAALWGHTPDLGYQGRVMTEHPLWCGATTH